MAQWNPRITHLAEIMAAEIMAAEIITVDDEIAIRLRPVAAQNH